MWVIEILKTNKSLSAMQHNRLKGNKGNIPEGGIKQYAF